MIMQLKQFACLAKFQRKEFLVLYRVYKKVDPFKLKFPIAYCINFTALSGSN
jgi:hypothetical protein